MAHPQTLLLGQKMPSTNPTTTTDPDDFLQEENHCNSGNSCFQLTIRLSALTATLRYINGTTRMWHTSCEQHNYESSLSKRVNQSMVNVEIFEQSYIWIPFQKILKKDCMNPWFQSFNIIFFDTVWTVVRYKFPSVFYRKTTVPL